MGEQAGVKKAIGTLIAGIVAEGIKVAMSQLIAQNKCVDFREGNAELIVHLNNGKIIRIQVS